MRRWGLTGLALVGELAHSGQSRSKRDRAGGAIVGEQPVVLTDGVVRLRAWEPDDAPAVYAACQDELIVRFLPIPQP